MKIVVRQWAPGAALALFVVVLLFPYFISGFLLSGDLRDVYLPLEDIYRHALAAGRLPTWSPLTALGYPVLASSQIGFWYPPLFVLRFLPPEFALAAGTLLHGILLAVGMLVYARSRRLSWPASLLSAIALTGSGFVIGHLTQTNIFLGVAWLPWALWRTDALARSLRGWTLWSLSVILALIALAGHFQIALMVLAFCGFRFLNRLRAEHHGPPFSTPPDRAAIRWGPQPWTHTLWTAFLFGLPLVVLVVLLSAAQLLPTLELLRESTRGGGGGFNLDRANQHSFPLWQGVTFILPAFFGFPDLSEYWGKRPQIEMTAWIGTVPFLLALVGALGRTSEKRGSRPPERTSDSDRRPQTLFWTITVLVSFLLALGRWSPLRLLGIEPTLGIFSGPARYLVLAEFSLALLAGFGLDAVRSRLKPRITRAVALLGLFGTLLIIGSFVFLKSRPETVRSSLTPLVDRVVARSSEHVLPHEAYREKVTYLLDRLQTWGVNLTNPLVLYSTALLGFGGGVLLWWVRSKQAVGKRVFLLPAACCLLTATELILIAWNIHPRVPWRTVTEESPLVAVLRLHPRGRIYVMHPPGDTGLLFANRTTDNRDEHERLLREMLVTNIHTRFGFPGIEWPASLDLAAASKVLGEMRDEAGRPVRHDLLDRLSVRYIVGSTATPGLEAPTGSRKLHTFPSGEGATVFLWERATPRPRAELFSRVPSDILAPLPPSAGTANIVRDDPQEVEIAVHNRGAQDASLVLRDTFFPGWEASVDHAPARIERADTLFRSVRVPPGSHVVVFTYRPFAARLGLALSTVTWLILLGAFLVRALSRRRSERA